jgi:uncharacterized membrane protein YphA (DoxX/SURF4 family)
MHHDYIDRVEQRFAAFMSRRGIDLMRVSLGIVFFWFGFLKFFDGVSPAEALAGKTMCALSFGALSPAAAVPILATWETLMGVFLVLGVLPRFTSVILLAHLSGTITPLFFFPHEVFTHVPYAPTMEGQYIIKNLVLISAALMVGAAMTQRERATRRLGRAFAPLAQAAPLAPVAVAR